MLTLVTEDEARLREAKYNAAEDARKKARGKHLHESRLHVNRNTFFHEAYFY